MASTTTMMAPFVRLRQLATSPAVEGLVLLLTRLTLAGVFWRAGRSKVVEGSWLTISDSTWYLFQEEYAGMPIPAWIGAPMATYAEHLLPVLLVLGLATRFSALALFGMTMMIQIFVYPEAWWQTHALWVVMALALVTRGGGALSVDRLIFRHRS